MGYLHETYVASTDWQYASLVSDTDNPWTNITISNDDAAETLLVKLNATDEDEITIYTGEVLTLNTEVVSIWYKSNSGTPSFRVICDG